MREQAERAVADHYVAFFEVAVQAAGVLHVMDVPPPGDEVADQPGGHVHHPKRVHDREPAAVFDVARQAEGGPQRGGVGHREARSVDHHDAVAQPAAGLVAGRLAGVGHVGGEVAEYVQRDPLPRGVVALIVGVDLRDPQHATDRAVAREHLDHEQVHRDDRVEDPVPPAVLGELAGIGDPLGIEQDRGVALEALNGRSDTGHPWPPGLVVN